MEELLGQKAPIEIELGNPKLECQVSTSAGWQPAVQRGYEL
jgi:phage tail tube protein FII